MKSTAPAIPLLDPSERWLSKQDVLALLFISDRTLQYWRSNDIIPYSRVGNKTYYRYSDIVKVLESRKVYK